MEHSVTGHSAFQMLKPKDHILELFKKKKEHDATTKWQIFKNNNKWHQNHSIILCHSVPATSSKLHKSFHGKKNCHTKWAATGIHGLIGFTPSVFANARDTEVKSIKRASCVINCYIRNICEQRKIYQLSEKHCNLHRLLAKTEESFYACMSHW